MSVRNHTRDFCLAQGANAERGRRLAGPVAFLGNVDSRHQMVLDDDRVARIPAQNALPLSMTLADGNDPGNETTQNHADEHVGAMLAELLDEAVHVAIAPISGGELAPSYRKRWP